MNRQNMLRSEETEQMAVIDWARCHEGRHPELKWLLHIPNGGKRSKAEAARFKAMGVRAGVSDLFLPCAHADYYGLFVEMKYGRNKLSEYQAEFITDMRKRGYCAMVAYSADAAIKIIDDYIHDRDPMMQVEGDA